MILLGPNEDNKRVTLREYLIEQQVNCVEEKIAFLKCDQLHPRILGMIDDQCKELSRESTLCDNFWHAIKVQRAELAIKPEEPPYHMRQEVYDKFYPIFRKVEDEKNAKRNWFQKLLHN